MTVEIAGLNLGGLAALFVRPPTAALHDQPGHASGRKLPHAPTHYTSFKLPVLSKPTALAAVPFAVSLRLDIARHMRSY
jgi:hypothetical protein